MKKQIKNREIKLIIVTMIVSLFLGWFFFHTTSEKAPHNHEMEMGEEGTKHTVYTCSMHPQIKEDKPGSCPICGMDLIPLKTMGPDNNQVDPNEIQMSESALALASVQTTIVTKGVPQKVVHLLGKVQADERNISKIAARYGGRIDDLFINFTGQKVRKGESLAMIYSPELIIAQKELLEAIKYKTSNPSFYQATRAKLKLWDLTEKQIDGIETRKQVKTLFEIKSPISGTVTKKEISTGDYVKEGTQLFEVVNLSKVWVLFDAYESDLPWIKRGDNIVFTLQSFPGKQYKGKVAFIDPLINGQTRVARVRLELNNANGKIKPGMFAKGTLKSNTTTNANEILIPKSAILWTGKRSVVYVKVSDSETVSFLRREIVLGPEAGNFYVVNKGLSVGEEIATNGVFKIDAAAQLEGKASMMNPTGAKSSAPHDMSNMSHMKH